MGSAAMEVLGVHAFLVEKGSLERAACRLGRQFVGSVVGTSSGNGLFETCGSETVVMGLNGTLAIAESAQCR